VSVDARLFTHVKERTSPTGEIGKVTADDAWNARVHFDNGVEGLFNFTQCGQGPPRKEVTIIGSNGCMKIDISDPSGKVVIYDNEGKEAGCWIEQNLPEGSKIPNHVWGKGTFKLAREILHRLEKNEIEKADPYMVDFQQSYYIQLVMGAIKESSRTKSEQKIPKD